MNIEFAELWLEQLAHDVPVNTRFSKAVVQAYRSKIARIVAARDERDLRAVPGLRFKELKGFTGIFSIRVNDQFRIVFSIRKAVGGNVIHVTDLTDYHK